MPGGVAAISMMEQGNKKKKCFLKTEEMLVLRTHMHAHVHVHTHFLHMQIHKETAQSLQPWN